MDIKDKQERFSLLYEEDRSFFLNYKEHFVKSFLVHTKDPPSMGGKLLESTAIKLYEAMFPFREESLQVIKNIFCTLAPCGALVRVAFLRSLLDMAQDYIQYLAQHLSSVSKAQRFLELISLYVDAVEETYRTKEAELKETSFKRGNVFVLVTFIKGLLEDEMREFYVTTSDSEGVIYPVKVREVDGVVALVEHEEGMYVKIGMDILLIHPKIHKPITARIVKVGERTFCAQIKGLGEFPKDRRKNIRVVPKEELKALLKYQDRYYQLKVANISPEGLSLVIGEDIRKSLKIGDRAEIEINLPTGVAIFEVLLKHICSKCKMVQAGFEIRRFEVGEEAFRRYNSELQDDILSCI